jgi:hypothetical protein
MNSILGEWREGKVRPMPGNTPRNRPVSRGTLSLWSVCDDPFLTTRFPQLSIPGARYAFSKAWAESIWSDGVQKPNPDSGTIPPPAGRPRAKVKERAGRITLFLIVRRRVPAGYSSIGLVATRARLRFTGTSRLTRTPQATRPKGTFLLCYRGDISILP